MKKTFGYALAMAIGLGAGAMISSKDVSAETLPQAASAAIQTGTDAAFRDGLFMGKHDADQGRLRHVATGRWSTSADRAQYQAGYEAGYTVR